MDTITLRQRLQAAGIDLAEPNSLEQRAFNFERALKIVLPPRDISDRTSFRRMTDWLATKCRAGEFDERIIFQRVIDFALEASWPKSRNPHAVFTSIFKKELGYSPPRPPRGNPTLPRSPRCVRRGASQRVAAGGNDKSRGWR